MKTQAKKMLRRALPGIYNSLQSLHQQRHIRRFQEKQRLPEIEAAFCARYSLQVMHGPFQAMKYVPQAAGSSFVPKLLGCYEEELHPLLEALIQTEYTAYTAVVDIGCAEGYYAVGLALRMPGANVYAFDTNKRARALCHKMALLNDVEARVRVAGECTTDTLRALGGAAALIVCDCEGAELQLLDPWLAPSLRQSTILVELHDCFGTPITPVLLSRFQSTHDINLIPCVSRNEDAYPEVKFLRSELRAAAVSEFRHSGQQWAFMRPREKVVK